VSHAWRRAARPRRHRTFHNRKLPTTRQSEHSDCVRASDHPDTIARGDGWWFRPCCCSGKSRLIITHQSAAQMPWSSQVMSSCVCEKAKGAILPLFVKAIKDRKQNAIHARHVHKAHHRPRAAPHFHKAALNHVGRPELPPQATGKAEEREQLGQVVLQLLHHRRINSLATLSESDERPLAPLANSPPGR
jgi:hypothetical protein